MTTRAVLNWWICDVLTSISCCASINEKHQNEMPTTSSCIFRSKMNTYSGLKWTLIPACVYTVSGHLRARTLMSDEPSCSNDLEPQLPRCAWLLACSVSRKDASPQSSASARRIPGSILSGNGVHRFRNHCLTSPEYAVVHYATRCHAFYANSTLSDTRTGITHI